MHDPRGPGQDSWGVNIGIRTQDAQLTTESVAATPYPPLNSLEVSSSGIDPLSRVLQTRALPLSYEDLVRHGGVEPPSAGWKPAVSPATPITH